MKIQQHDGVVVDAAVTAAGLRRAFARGRGVAGEREAPELQRAAASLPLPLYRPLGGAPALGDPISQGGGGQGGGVPPKASGAPPPHPRVSTLGAGGGPRGAHQPTMGWFPSPLQPLGPS